jgi:transposase
MKQPRFSAEAKMNIVLEVLRGDRSVSEVCREHRISLSLFYRWKDKFMVGALKALSPQKKGLGDSDGGENRHLKQLIGELTIENQILKKTQELMSPRSK